MNINFNQEIAEIERVIISKLLEFLETGSFNKTHSNYVTAYSKVLELADMDGVAQSVYDYYDSTIRNYTKRIYNTELYQAKGNKLLQCLCRRWENHKILVYWMWKVFYYLDRYHVKSYNLPKLFTVGLNIFQTEVFTKIKQTFCGAVINAINAGRNGENLDTQLVKESLICIAQMGLGEPSIKKVRDDYGDRLVWEGNPNLENYVQYFEKDFLILTEQFYIQKASGWITSMSCPEYLHELKKVFDFENFVSDTLLDARTKDPLFNLIVKTIVSPYARTLTDMEGTGCDDMFANDKQEDLKIMFYTFKRDETTFDYITAHMSSFLEEKGSTLVNNQELQKDAIEYTKQLLTFKAEVDGMVEYSFENNHKFQKCRDLAFQHFMNKCKFSAPYLAMYADNEMRRGFKGKSEIEVENALIALVRLFICLHDRDVFIKHYTRLLSKRLLDGTSVSDEAEQSLISKLKVECGHNVVNKISNMYQDIELSKTLNEEFKQQRHGGQPGGIQLSVQVLRNGCWPDQGSEPCQMPTELREASRAFELFYNNKHQGRNMNWLMNVGTVEIGTNFTRNSYTCVVNPQQAAVLFLFNAATEVPFNIMQEQLRISATVLKEEIVQFFNPKNKLLLKSSRGKSINDNEVIKLNEDFKCNSRRIDFRGKSKKMKVDVNAEDQSLIAERKNILDAVIVRIMKSRRTLNHQELMAETMRQVNHFRPQPAMIKGQIESLIQREFLRREEGNRSVYVYIP